MAIPNYQFLLRNPSSLAVTFEVRPQDVQTAEWTRDQFGFGSWSMTLPRNDTYRPEALAKHSLLEVMRDGRLEFVGALELRQVDELARFWTVGGPQLTAWMLGMRVVGETTPDNRSGAAETVLKGYVTAYLGSSAAAPRQLATYLTTATFVVEADQGRGTTVSVAANRKYLSQLSQEVCIAGNVVQEIAVRADRAGYDYKVTVPTNATVSAGARPFSVSWDNVAQFQFVEDYRQHKNFLYIAGNGSGAARAVSEVSDAGSITADWRREVVIDAAYATTADARTTVGTYEQALRRMALVGVKASPLYGGGPAVYHQDWDVGWDVTLAQGELREASVDVRIAAATVRLAANEIETVGFTLGLRRQDSELRRLADAVIRLQQSGNT
ncbi:MAG: hypothetical protein IT299_11090 [Dehalococcoidia bacterium]|nr:hypothetical protein [Dehalococcoidia bacterium]